MRTGRHYEAGLRRRGSLTLWIDAALDHWRTFGPGGQERQNDAAIQTTLIGRSAFSLAQRRTAHMMAPPRRAHGNDIQFAISPRSAAVLSGEPAHSRSVTGISGRLRGRLAWRKATDYCQRFLVETTMGRYKTLIAPRPQARDFAAQKTEAAIDVAFRDQMPAAGRVDSVRCRRMTVCGSGLGSPRAPSARCANAARQCISLS